VPPSARANAPSRAEVAPVKAPFSCPKNSLPDSSGTTVEQSSTTRSRRSGRRSSVCISRARSSFPVPLSPMSSTDESANFAASIVCRSSDIHAALRPTRFFVTSADPSTASTCAHRSKRARMRLATSRPSSHTATSEAPADRTRNASSRCSPDSASATPSTRTRPSQLILRTRSRSAAAGSSKNTSVGPIPSAPLAARMPTSASVRSTSGRSREAAFVCQTCVTSMSENPPELSRHRAGAHMPRQHTITMRSTPVHSPPVPCRPAANCEDIQGTHDRPLRKGTARWPVLSPLVPSLTWSLNLNTLHDAADGSGESAAPGFGKSAAPNRRERAG
jgi:hypothetical protein